MRQIMRSNWMQQVVFLGPSLTAFTIIILIPFILSIYYSMVRWNGVSSEVVWIGLDNFRTIIFNDKDFANSFWFTTKLTAAIVVFSNLLGFTLAYVLTHSLKLRNAMRTIFFIPNVLGGLLLGFIWQFIFINSFQTIGDLTQIKLFQLSWLGTEATAFWGIVIVSVWQLSGYVMVIYIAGLVSVPSSLKEAAMIDGAKAWQVLRHIIIPMVMPAFTVCLFWTTSWAFKIFDVNFSLTAGGPFKSTESVAMNIYFEAFEYNRFGLGTAKALIFFIVVAAISSIQVYLTKRKEVEL